MRWSTSWFLLCFTTFTVFCHYFPTALYTRWLRISNGVQLLEEENCSSIGYSVFVLFSSNYGVVNIKISDLQPHHILFLFDILTFWTMRRTSCVYRGAAAEGVKHCLQGIVRVRVRERDEMSDRPAASLFSKVHLESMCASLPITDRDLLKCYFCPCRHWLGGREKSLLTWFQSQNHSKEEEKRKYCDADCKRPRNWSAGPQRARLLSDQPCWRTARATHCRE